MHRRRTAPPASPLGYYAPFQLLGPLSVSPSHLAPPPPRHRFANTPQSPSRPGAKLNPPAKLGTRFQLPISQREPSEVVVEIRRLATYQWNEPRSFAANALILQRNNQSNNVLLEG